MSTFTDFKNNFYSRVTDFTLFDCGDVNLLKVVLDGLKVDYVSKGKVRAYLFYPFFVQAVFSKIKRYRSKKTYNEEDLLKKIAWQNNKTFLISDAGRILYDSENAPRSLYFDNIIKISGRENTVFILDKVIDAKLDFDFSVKGIEYAFINLPLSREEKVFRIEILNTFNKIKKSKIFSQKELDNIQFAFHRFFYQYKTWNTFLKLLPNIKKSYFVCHYHKEGQILALKRNHIEAIELQHGLIASQDIFYIFPKNISLIKDKALFADKILVYGQYWKDALLKGSEYSSDQIKIIGYYLFNDFSNYTTEKTLLKKLVGNKEVILITTQTFIHSHFIDYTIELAKNIEKTKRNAIILLKPHPSENPEVYLNVFSNSEIVKVVQNSLPLLLEISSVNVSIFSTTVYDSLRYKLKNFVYRVKGFEDYVDEIIRSGIAEEIKLGQNPLDMITNVAIGNTLQPNYYYQELDQGII